MIDAPTLMLASKEWLGREAKAGDGRRGRTTAMRLAPNGLRCCTTAVEVLDARGSREKSYVGFEAAEVHEVAIEFVRRHTVAECRSTGATVWVPLYLAFLTRAHADVGQFDDAWRCIGEAISTIETTKERWFEAETNRIAGEIALKSPEPDAAKAEAYFERALAVALSNTRGLGSYAQQ